MKKYPLKLDYIAKTALWGGDRLKKKYNKSSEYEKISETWEVSVRENGTNTIQNGEYAGMSLWEYLTECVSDGDLPIGRRHDHSKPFPLLIKFIDAEDKLSVQVHPTDEYARENEKDPGKTEMWYIIEAEDGAEIIYGLAEGESAGSLEKALSCGKAEEVLRHVTVKSGDCFFIPAGMPHAIGAGIIILEIQQNSDLTYRLYDYNRKDKAGNLRELHIKKALDVIHDYSADECEKIRFSDMQKEIGGQNRHIDSEVLAKCKYFHVEKAKFSDKYCFNVDNDSFASITFISGDGEMIFENASYPFTKGDTYFMPAGAGEINIIGSAEAIIAKI